MKALLIAALSMGLLALGLSPIPVVAQANDPGAVVLAWETALNVGDVNAALALWSEDGILKEIPPPPGTTGVFSGKDQLLIVFQGAVASHSHFDVSNAQVSGDTVTFTETFIDDGFRKLETGPLQATVVAVVQGGKIKTLTGTVTPDSLAKIQAAATKVASLPKSGEPTVPVGIAMGGLALGGFGLALRRRHRGAM